MHVHLICLFYVAPGVVRPRVENISFPRVENRFISPGLKPFHFPGLKTRGYKHTAPDGAGCRPSINVA